jgi:hypothetical protein
MSKLVIGLTAFVLLAAGGALAGGAITDSSSDDPATTGTTTGAEVATTLDDRRTTSTETSEDVSGPCDELEHANDPGCAGEAVTEDEHPEDDADHREDRSGSNSGRGSSTNEKEGHE